MRRQTKADRARMQMAINAGRVLRDRHPLRLLDTYFWGHLALLGRDLKR